jgi:hypothetical protein
MPGSTGFRVVAEQEIDLAEVRLRIAVRQLRREFGLPRWEDDIAREIMGTVHRLSNLIEARPGDVDQLVRQVALGDTLELFAELRSSETPRRRGQAVNALLSTRPKWRGRPAKLDPEIVLAFCESVERVVGRKLSYGHPRNRHAPSGTADTGRAEGAMLEVLLAALDWAFAIYRPRHEYLPVKAEAVLTVIKKARHPARQD